MKIIIVSYRKHTSCHKQRKTTRLLQLSRQIFGSKQNILSFLHHQTIYVIQRLCISFINHTEVNEKKNGTFWTSSFSLPESRKQQSSHNGPILYSAKILQFFRNYRQHCLCSVQFKALIIYKINVVRFEVLTATSIKKTVFWDVAPCSLVEVYRRCGGACCLQHHAILSPTLLMMEVVNTSETSVNLYDTTQRNIASSLRLT
jgi:hypothetical protein